MNAKHTFTGPSFFMTGASVYALCTAMALPALGQTQESAETPETNAEVNVTDYGTVDLAVQDTDLTQVLQMLSIQGKKNIITSKSVSATVTANLYDVTFYEALKAILEVNGYTYYEEGNFIYVITREEADQMAKAARKTESRIYEVQFLSAKDAQDFITPLLSESGKASSIGEVTPGFKADMQDGGADNWAYSVKLVVNDYPENLENVASLLTDLDTAPQQVLVEAVVLKTKLNEDNAFGIDFNVIADMDFTDLTSPLSAVTNLLNGDDKKNGFQPPDNKAQAVQSTVGDTRAPGGFKVGVISDEVSVFLRVLDEVTDSTVLARPKVMALNRQRAQVLVGTRVGYLSTTATETTTTQSVNFLDTGINLNFRPFITTDGMIRMELEPKVSEASLRTVTDANGQSVTIPDEFTNQLTTNVRVKDGQTLILGGLFKEDTTLTRRQVPLLGDIPVVGAAFRGQDDKIRRDEIIFLITPTILQDQALWAAGQDAMGMVEPTRIGARAGLLFFGQTAMTDKYNQDAVDAYNAGNTERALYYANNSLRLAPDQPQMITFRELLTGQKAHALERSLMEGTFRRQLGGVTTGTIMPRSGDKAALSEPVDPSAATVEYTTEETMTEEPVMEEPVAQTTEQTFDSETASVPVEGSWNEIESAASEPIAEVTEPESFSSASTEAGSAVSTDGITEVKFTETGEKIIVSSPPSGGEQSSEIESEPAATSTVVVPDDSSASLTSEQQLFFQDFLHDFFMACGLPTMAMCYVSVDDSFWDGTAYENPTEVLAGVQTTSIDSGH